MSLLATLFFNIKFTWELLAAEYLFLAKTKKRKNFSIRFLGMVVICTAVSILLNFDFMEQHIPAFYPLGGVVRYLAVLICTILSVSICYECPKYQTVMYSICGYAVQHIAYSIHELFLLAYSMFLPAGKIDVVYLLSYGITYLAVYALINFTLIRSINSQPYPIKLWTILALSAGVLLNILVFNLCTYGFDNLQLFLFRLLSVNTCLLSLIVLKTLMEVRNLQKDVEFVRQLSTMKKDYYEFLKESIETTNIRCHDFKYQISQLRKKKENSSLESTLSDMERSINVFDTISKTGNEALDVVLTEKGVLCQKEKIRFTYLVDSEKLAVLEDSDIYALFGNMLDNAIEAVRELPNPEEKVINLSVFSKGKLLNIHIYNFYATQFLMADGLPQTTKTDASLHGYGMKSIKMIAEKYQGEMQISANDRIFELNLLIPLE